MKTSILSANDKTEYQSEELEPGASVTITGTLGEADANGDYPLTVESITPAEPEAPEETENEDETGAMMEKGMGKGMMGKGKKKPGIAAVLEG